MGMIRTQDGKDYFESVCRGPHIYHWACEFQLGYRAQCGQQNANLTDVIEFVNCRKCKHNLGIEYNPRMSARRYR